LYIAVAELLAWLYRLEGGGPPAAVSEPQAQPEGRPPAAAPRARSTGPGR
jgi:hypothetical protein